MCLRQKIILALKSSGAEILIKELSAKMLFVKTFEAGNHVVILLINMLVNLHKPLKSSILKLNTKNVTEWRSPCHFETAIIKDFFSFVSFSITQSEIFYFLTSS